jgi:hypothetical protein
MQDLKICLTDLILCRKENGKNPRERRFSMMKREDRMKTGETVGRMKMMVQGFIILALLVFCLFPAAALEVASPYDSAYTLTDLGPPPGVPARLGGVSFITGDPQALLVGGDANTAEGMLYKVTLVRDAQNHIVGFSGTATVYAEAPYNDGGVVFGPGGVLFLSRWPVNELGQVKPGSSVTDKVIDLAALGGASSNASLNFIPAGYPGAGSFKLLSWSEGQWYTATISPDGTGTYNIDTVTYSGISLPGGPEGFTYAPPGSPMLPDYTTMLVAEYSGGQVVTYQMDSLGNPVLSSGTSFVTGLEGAEGAAIDPMSGDFVFSTFGGGDRIVVVRGFATPPVAYYDFTTDQQEWTSHTAPLAFGEPNFAVVPGFLQIISTDNTNTFGYWQSPPNAVPADSDYLYRARFTVSTDLTDKALIPQIRLRANSLNLQQYDVLSIESAGDGGASPDPAGTDYDLYFVPPANDTSAMLAFDLLNFNPFDAAVAQLALDTVVVERFALDSLSTPTLVQDYTFELSADGWTTGGAPIVFSPPQYIHALGAVELRALTNTNTFGYWVNDPADITIEAGKLYRGTFDVRTDVTNPALVPEIRLRFNTGNLQAWQAFGISSAGDGANSPGLTNTTYDRVYFLPPPNCAGEDLIVSFDILNFNPADVPAGSLILDRALIETLSPPALP